MREAEIRRPVEGITVQAVVQTLSSFGPVNFEIAFRSFRATVRDASRSKELNAGSRTEAVTTGIRRGLVIL